MANIDTDRIELVELKDGNFVIVLNDNEHLVYLDRSMARFLFRELETKFDHETAE